MVVAEEVGVGVDGCVDQDEAKGEVEEGGKRIMMTIIIRTITIMIG